MIETALERHLDELVSHRDRLAGKPVAELFSRDINRSKEFSITAAGMVFDYSRHKLDQQALQTLLLVAQEADIAKAREVMFRGDMINASEERSVLHTALRKPRGEHLNVDGHEVVSKVHGVLERMAHFCRNVRDGTYAPSGKPITHVVNIGIGGSDLGPRMVCEALKSHCKGPEPRFVANVDPADLADRLDGLDPASTLFLVASKTFTTRETMANARAARAWSENALGKTAPEHFVAISTNTDATQAFGISQERTFGFWDWVGGRFSVWSSIGLSVMLAIGPEKFHEFLAGAHAADQHFCQAPLRNNMPVMMALLGVWYRNIVGSCALAVLPYDQRLEHFPAWLQQLDMESNGKSVTANGDWVHLDTAPVIFGEPGTNGQHAFFQLLHQGTESLPCDFLLAANPSSPDLNLENHRILVANCLAQVEALMAGRDLDEAGGDMQRVFEGSRPASLLLYPRLDPYRLGFLMALYEHKIFVQGVLWGLNSFDQWGVELGKEIAGRIEPMLNGMGRNNASPALAANLEQLDNMAE